MEVLYSDGYLIVVNKPSGLLSVPGRIEKDCVVSRMAAQFGWIREVHRLDQATSGLMVLARKAEAHRKISTLFAERQVNKKYHAYLPRMLEDPGIPGVSFFLQGCDNGRIELFQRLDVEHRPMQIIDEECGKKAVTEWQVLSHEKSGVLVEYQLLTGRTHQLRLASSVCGAPIIGDRLYSDSDTACSVLNLHAFFLEFVHPELEKKIRITCPENWN